MVYETLPHEEEQRILWLLMKDRAECHRDQYVYTRDILSYHQVYPIPNEDARRVITDSTTYNELPCEERNEGKKGAILEDQHRFLQKLPPSVSILCEAMNHEPCLREACPLYRAPGSLVGITTGICVEFKMTFSKQ